jgi:hypothetical protein
MGKPRDQLRAWAGVVTLAHPIAALEEHIHRPAL